MRDNYISCRMVMVGKRLLDWQVKKSTRESHGAYVAALGGLDAVVFIGDIGENDVWVRNHCCSRLEVLAIPTDEELEIALQTVSCIRKTD